MNTFAPWYAGWVVDHCARCRASRLPKPTSEEGVVFFASIGKAFAVRGITEAAATAASERLQAEPATGPKHVATLIRFAVEALRDSGAAPNVSPVDDTREAAEAASRDCQWCHAVGLVPVYRAGHVPASVSALCVCRLGAWIRSTWSRRQPQDLRRTPELSDVLAGRSTWSTDRPSYDPGFERLAGQYSPAELIREWTRRARESPASPTIPRRPHTPPPPISTVERDPILRAESHRKEDS